MTPHAKLGIAGIIIGFILLFIVPWPIALALIVLAIAVPAGAWLMLDESQRRRYRELRRRQRVWDVSQVLFGGGVDAQLQQRLAEEVLKHV